MKRSNADLGMKKCEYKVIARGFPWNVTKRDVIEFFKGVEILNGEHGISIVKNHAMEAHIELSTAKDRDNALSRHKRKIGSQIINGT